jgi:hypothetical protein
MLPLTFADSRDYDKVREDDRISILGLSQFAPGKQLTMALTHADGSTEQVALDHTFNENQISWFKAGSALNLIASKARGSMPGQKRQVSAARKGGDKHKKGRTSGRTSRPKGTSGKTRKPASPAERKVRPRKSPLRKNTARNPRKGKVFSRRSSSKGNRRARK